MKIAALVLAAGAGSRFGGGKQWADVDGQPMLGWVIENCRGAGCDPVQVVTGYAHDKVGEICRVFGAQTSYHEHWKRGMSASVNYGLHETLQISVWEYLLIMAGDMPWFNPSIFLANEVASFRESNTMAMGIQYPEGIGMPLLLSRALVEKHCYFVSQKNDPSYPLRKSLDQVENLISFPAGPHTRDVDHPDDLAT